MTEFENVRTRSMHVRIHSPRAFVFIMFLTAVGGGGGWLKRRRNARA